MFQTANKDVNTALTSIPTSPMLTASVSNRALKGQIGMACVVDFAQAARSFVRSHTSFSESSRAAAAPIPPRSARYDGDYPCKVRAGLRSCNCCAAASPSPPSPLSSPSGLGCDMPRPRYIQSSSLSAALPPRVNSLCALCAAEVEDFSTASEPRGTFDFSRGYSHSLPNR